MLEKRKTHTPQNILQFDKQNSTSATFGFYFFAQKRNRISHLHAHTGNNTSRLISMYSCYIRQYL